VKHVRFVSRLLNRPQMIAPAAGAAVLAALVPGAHLRGWEGEAEVVERDGRAYGVDAGLAVIPVVGELVHRGGAMDAMSGVTSYQALADMVSDALADSSVSAVLLDIDSPGGEAAGCLDFSEWLASQRGVKPIWASVNQLACSAAYAIASAADRIFIGEDGLAGSIGVAWYHVDVSQALSKSGVKVTYVFEGARKVDGAPELPLSAEAMASVKQRQRGIYERFCALVARNRGLSMEAVMGTEAGVFRGRDALAAGLADAIATYEEAVMALATQTAPVGAQMSAAANRGRTLAAKPKDEPEVPANVPPVEAPIVPVAPGVPDTSEPGALPVDVPSDQPRPTPPASPGFGPADAVAVAEACTRGGHPELIAGLLSQRASLASVQADVARAQGIAGIGKNLGLPTAAAKAITGGMSLEVFREVAFAAKADADGGIRTDTGNRGSASMQASSPNPAAIYDRINTPKKAA
jgi:signal peptide peptidase SppA